MENDVQVLAIKNGWAAVGKDWAVFGKTKEDALQQARMSEAKHLEIYNRDEQQNKGDNEI